MKTIHYLWCLFKGNLSWRLISIIPGAATLTNQVKNLYLKEGKATLMLAGPVIGSQLGQMSMGFVDTLMVGRLGPEQLAGVALGNTLFFFQLIVCMGVINAVAPMVSQAFGAGEHEPVERSVRQGFVVSVLLAVPCTLIILEFRAFFATYRSGGRHNFPCRWAICRL